METLNERFNALQDKLMDIYESGLETLETQIDHWQLLRQEQIILHYARKHGILRLGYQLVPPLATSETKAKEAIGMVLLLQSLQRSAYASEPWTLVQTSLETVRNAPENCFKKEPKNIEVIFDGDPENLMSYTVWTYIYFQNSDDEWQKVEGHVDYDGAYYYDGHNKHYYIKFEKDANRYSKTGLWEVHVNKDTVFTPVTSSTPPLGGERASPVSIDPSSRPSVGSSTTNTKRPRTGRYGRKESSPTTTSRRQPAQRGEEQGRKQKGTRSQKTQRQRSRSRSRSSTRRGGQETDRGGGVGGRERRRGGSSQGHSPTSRGRRRGGGRRPQTRSRSRSRSSGASSELGVSPSEVGRSVHSVGRDHRGRLARLLDEAKDPPIILLRGEANQLKCYRYRARQRHKGHYKYFSSTWSWIGEHSTDRIGRSRMVVSFTSNTQREHFIDTMRLPQGVDWSYGNFDSL